MKLGIFWLWIWLMCLPFLGGTTSLMAQETTTKTEKTIRYDRTKNLEPVSLDQQQIEKYRSQKEFDYSRNKIEENWWSAFKKWVSYHWNRFWDKLFEFGPPGSWLYPLVIGLKYLFILSLVGLVIWLFIKLNPGSAMLKPKRMSEVLLTEDEKIIQRKDIPKLIEKAQKEGNYRLAIRYYYLWILKLLKDHEIIDYQAQKTNQQYQMEIADPKLTGNFAEITYLYDFVWYGEFDVREREFNQWQQKFVQIENDLKNKSYV